MAKRNGPTVEPLSDADEGGFWQQCVIMSLRSGANSDVAIASADNAVKAYRNRQQAPEDEPVSE